MKSVSFIKPLVMIVFFSAVVGGCYLPIRYDAEIEIHRTGHYDFKFDGYLARVELFQGLKEGTIGPEKEKRMIEQIKADFGRDPSVKEFKYLKMGHFKVNWQRAGDLIKTKTVSFFNPTSEFMLGIRYNSKTRQISMLGKSIKRDAKKKLDAMGLGSRGQIRIFTDAKVISHNATKVEKNKRLGGRYMTYIWVIKNIFAPTPSLVIQIL